MTGFSTTALAGFTLLIGLATVAVILSQHAQTTAIINSLSAGVANSIGAAVSPVTGSTMSITTSATQ